MALPRALIDGPPDLNRFALSTEFCRIGWTKLDGGLKDVMAHVTMLAMHKDGRTTPPPRWGRNPPTDMTFGSDTDAPLEPPHRTLGEVRSIRLRTVLGGTS